LIHCSRKLEQNDEALKTSSLFSLSILLKAPNPI
jgi:hypothetical protein